MSAGVENTSRNVSTAARGSGDRRLSRSPAPVRAAPLRAMVMPGRDGLGRELHLAGGGRSGAEHVAAPHPLAHELLEHRIARVLRDAHSPGERQVREVEIARAPAEQVRVERDDDGFAAGCLGPPQQRGVELVGRRPVELEQPRAAGRGIPHLLHGNGCLVAQRVGHTQRRRGPRHGEVGLGVGHLHDPERREQQGCRARRGRGSRSDRSRVGDIAQRSRPDLPATELRAVGGHGALGPGAARDVRERLGAERLAGGASRARRRRPGRGAWCR